jgi:hypothetical protein
MPSWRMSNENDEKQDGFDDGFDDGFKDAYEQGFHDGFNDNKHQNTDDPEVIYKRTHESIDQLDTVLKAIDQHPSDYLNRTKSYIFRFFDNALASPSPFTPSPTSTPPLFHTASLSSTPPLPTSFKNLSQDLQGLEVKMEKMNNNLSLLGVINIAHIMIVMVFMVIIYRKKHWKRAKTNVTEQGREMCVVTHSMPSV